MSVMYVNMADLNMRLGFRHSELARSFDAYQTDPGPCEIDVRPARRAITEIARRAETTPSPRYAEFLALSEAISERLPLYGGVLIHAACLSVDGRAYLFLAPSGTGKTTHMRLWMAQLGERARVINGDKPFVRLRAGRARAYGNPWAGKENLHANLRADLGALLFLERAATDEIAPLSPAQALPRLIRQVYLPHNEPALDQTLRIIAGIVRLAPAYLMRCTMRKSAAQVAIARTLSAEKEDARCVN